MSLILLMAVALTLDGPDEVLLRVFGVLVLAFGCVWCFLGER
jgi:hypothetical protein